ncbi:hypothetical protein [Limnoglobus roseus]|uniref:Uncharacterized protein n=1 Tax=Limnoglobus roseus TaxID=2598579 RepID=A0A5C1A715_9BACT|nr:hypothetical protein [Limnoglobus roseus]QEL14053.1 hypothetical protein PX52LOC_00916 [Limnoglobus roseus]
MASPVPNDTQQGNRNDQPASPYGPQPYGTDEAAGGADSSPYENEPSGERADKAKEDKGKRTQQEPPGSKPVPNG